MASLLAACAPAATTAPTAAPAKPTAAPAAKPAAAPTTAPAAKPAAAPTAATAAKPAAAASSGSSAEVLAGAQQEGRVVFYTAMNINQARPLADAFQKKYPFIQEVEILRLDGEDLLGKITTEARASQKADATSLTDVAAVDAEGLFVPYVSPESAVFAADQKHPQGHWNFINLNASVIIYNTGLVTAAEAPKTYDDLLDPKWKGQILLDEADWDWMLGIKKMMGDAKAGEFLKGLSAQDVQLRKGHGVLVQLCSAGEAKLAACAQLNTVLQEKDKGAPIEWVRTPQIWAEGHGIGLFKNAPHPNAGKLWIDYTLSAEGQQLLADEKRVVGRPGVKGGLEEIVGPNVKVVVIDPNTSLKQGEYQKEFEGYFLKRA